MGYFIKGTDNGTTPLKHSQDIFKQYLLGMVFSNYIGKKGSGKPIIADDKEFAGKDCGDTARFHFIPQVYGDGIEGQNASIEGNEDTLSEFTTDVKIDQVAKAFRKKGKMTDIRTIFDIRAEFKDQLANWFKWRTENDIISALTGYTTDGVTKLVGTARNTTPLVNGAGRCFRPDIDGSSYSSVIYTSAQSTNNNILNDITSADKLNTYFLDELQSLAKTANSKYPMKPIRLADGNEYYVLMVHPKVAIQLRQDERWEKRVLAMYNGYNGLEKDPVATGAIGVWEKIIIKEAEYITTAEKGGVKIARNLLLGADAAIMAYAQTLDYTEELFDYKREMGVAADEIRGIKKLDFDGVDLNVAQVVSAI